jgi:[ribosomal protein S5]-alanine N-acetyltransferase
MTWTPPTLETARLVLRPITEADADAVFAACSNPKLTEYTLFEEHISPAASLAFIRTYVLPNYEQGLPDPFGVAFKDDPGRLIGCAGGRWNTQANYCVEFGYWIAEPFWGRGYATEAVRALVAYLFESLSPERIQAHTMGPNAASGRVLEKAGLRYEGTLRSALFHRGRFWDMRMYAVLRDEVMGPSGRQVALPGGDDETIQDWKTPDG